MSEERNTYDFCPKCGALTRDGVCTSCGYGMEDKSQPAGQPQSAYEAQSGQQSANQQSTWPGSTYQPASGQPGGQNNYYNQPYGQPPYYGDQKPKKKKMSGGAIAAIIIGAVAVVITCAVLLFFGLRSFYSSIFNEMGGLEEFYFGDDFHYDFDYDDDNGYDYNYDDDYSDDLDPFFDWDEEDQEKDYDEEGSYYVPSADDEYYEEIVNAERNDLSYTVEWQEYELDSDQAYAAAEGNYPLLQGDIPNLDTLNKEIEQRALAYRDMCRAYASEYDVQEAAFESYSEGYITYMDEEVISIVFQNSFYMNGYIGALELDAINIDVKEGRVLGNNELIDYNEALGRRFREQSNYQNGTIDLIEEINDSEISGRLSGPKGVAFYTPVGLEIGFSYTSDYGDGWVTATIKETAGNQS